MSHLTNSELFSYYWEMKRIIHSAAAQNDPFESGERMIDWMRAWMLWESVLVLERKHIKLMKKKR